MARPLQLDEERLLVGGVLAGLARRLEVDPLVVRIGFGILVAATGGLALVAYALAWYLIPSSGARPARPERVPRPGAGARRVAAGVGLLVLAVLLAFRELGVWWSDALVWPLVLAASGAALLWGQSRRPGATAPAPTTAPPEPSGWAPAIGVYRGGFGVALVVGAGILFLYANGALEAASDAALAAVVVLVGVGLVLAPFLWRLGRNLAAERAVRIRSQERAELSAHLHDSVLQTLALVQQRANDPRDVAQLARRQERELRAWLSGEPAPRPDERLSDSLRAAAAEIEEAHGVQIEVVTVGDCPLDERGEALAAAAREALLNAAKFAGEADPIRVFVEADDERVQVFVHDRGPGFDPDAVPPDRRGVRESILGRMERHGGRAVVRSAPGTGTEVELTIERNGR
jgi:signal transduction histidine kinase